MSLSSLRKVNAIEIHELSEPGFARYGRLLSGYDATHLIALVDGSTAIDGEKNTYVASVPEFEKDSLLQVFSDAVFGGLPLQAGYCNGPNSKLNGLEYHKTPEIFIAITDCVLILGRLEDVRAYRNYDTAKTEVFFFPAGSIVECFASTLHFSPCKTESSGFKSIIILPRGTNFPLDANPVNAEDPETRLLFMKNKWLLAHIERTPLIERGAWPGLDGKNIEIFPGD